MKTRLGLPWGIPGWLCYEGFCYISGDQILFPVILIGFLRSLFLLKFSVLTPEAFHSTRRINQLLFPCKKGVAFGADLNLDFLCRGTCLKFVATGTVYDGFVVFWMNSFFHSLSSLITNIVRCSLYSFFLSVKRCEILCPIQNS